MQQVFDEAAKEQQQSKKPGPVQVARFGQKKAFRPKPPTATDQPAKPKSSTPKRRKGNQR